MKLEENFFKSISNGPIYPCIVCHRTFFLKSSNMVAIPDLLVYRDLIHPEIYQKYVTAFQEHKVQNMYYSCNYCHKSLLRKICPSMAASNNLYLDPIPEELKLTDLEQQLIARNLIFMKIAKLPKSRLHKIVDRVINVPLEDNDIEKTVTSLPRKFSNSQLQFVKFKRMKSLKNSHCMQFIRPNMLINAIMKLKDLKNPFYENINVNEKFTDEDDNSSSNDEEINQQSSDEEDILESVQRYQAKTSLSTCLIPENPQNFVIFNNSNEKLIKRMSNENLGIEIAPGEGRIPCDWLKETNFDSKSFPILFPSGQFGLNEEREFKLSTMQYFCQRILNFDKRFANSDPFIFCAQQRIERETLETSYNISFNKGSLKQETNGKFSMNSPDYFEIFSNIRGTPKYWHNMRLELIAKLHQLGPFHIFYTLSCAELRWPEVIANILLSEGKNVVISRTFSGKFSEITVDNLPLNDFLSKFQIDTHKLIRENILMVIRIFDHRLRSFTSKIILKQWCKLKIQYFTYRIEFQLRGLPHCHGVLWFDKEDIEPYYLDGTQEFDGKKLVQLIDDLISCEIPNTSEELCEIVNQVQIHNHTKKCLNSTLQCKYKFPRFPSKRTLISKPLDEDLSDSEKESILQDRSAILNKVLNALTNKEVMTAYDNIEDLFHDLNIDYEHYEACLLISDHGNNVILKRNLSEIFVNNYNPTFLKLWNANMDIQICTDAYAVLTYITEYFTKGESELTFKLRDVFNQSKNKGERQCKKELKQTYIAQREISICEAIYRLLPQLLMKNSNITCKFLNSSLPDKRPCLLKNVKNIKGKTDAPTIQLTERTGEFVKVQSAHDKYCMRPWPLSNLVFAQFVILYTNCYKLPKKIRFVNGISQQISNVKNLIDESDLPKYIQLFDNTIMVSKNHHSVLRFHKYNQLKEQFQYAYSQIMMFSSWRNEENDLFPSDMMSCLEKYNSNMNEIEEIKKKNFPFSIKIEISDDLQSNEHFAGILLDNEFMKENESLQKNDDYLEHLHPGEFENFETNCIEENSSKYKLIEIENEEELYKLARSLIVEQKLPFNKVIEHCFSLVSYDKMKLPPPKPVYILMHGSGGNGKSQVIRCIAKWSEKILQKEGQDIFQPRIILASFTGTAARQIGGITLHSAFNFQFGYSGLSLSDKNMDELRKGLQNLKLIIIDEISMLSADLFYALNQRLCSVFQNKLPFGGISVILVGDLLQIKPVQGRYIFQTPIYQPYANCHEICNLWELFSVFILKHNHRQGESREWTAVLNKIRNATVTDSDLIEINKHILSFWDEENYGPEKNATFIFHTNLEVNRHNDKILSKLHSKVYSVKAKVYLPPGRKYKITNNGQIDNTGFLEVLNISNQCKIMIIKNIDTSDGLTNGTIGTIEEIICQNGEVKLLLIHFSDLTIGKRKRLQFSLFLKNKNAEHLTPITKTEHTYNLPSKNKDKPHESKCSLQQFPIRLAFGVTGHKVQGHTFAKGEKVVINNNRKFPG